MSFSLLADGSPSALCLSTYIVNENSGASSGHNFSTWNSTCTMSEPISLFLRTQRGIHSPNSNFHKILYDPGSILDCPTLGDSFAYEYSTCSPSTAILNQQLGAFFVSDAHRHTKHRVTERSPVPILYPSRPSTTKAMAREESNSRFQQKTCRRPQTTATGSRSRRNTQQAQRVGNVPLALNTTQDKDAHENWSITHSPRGVNFDRCNAHAYVASRVSALRERCNTTRKKDHAVEFIPLRRSSQGIDRNAFLKQDVKQHLIYALRRNIQEVQRRKKRLEKEAIQRQRERILERDARVKPTRRNIAMYSVTILLHIKIFLYLSKMTHRQREEKRLEMLRLISSTRRNVLRKIDRCRIKFQCLIRLTSFWRKIHRKFNAMGTLIQALRSLKHHSHYLLLGFRRYVWKVRQGQRILRAYCHRKRVRMMWGLMLWYELEKKIIHDRNVRFAHRNQLIESGKVPNIRPSTETHVQFQSILHEALERIMCPSTVKIQLISEYLRQPLERAQNSDVFESGIQPVKPLFKARPSYRRKVVKVDKETGDPLIIPDIGGSERIRNTKHFEQRKSLDVKSPRGERFQSSLNLAPGILRTSSSGARTKLPIFIPTPVLESLILRGREIFFQAEKNFLRAQSQLSQVASENGTSVTPMPTVTVDSLRAQIERKVLLSIEEERLLWNQASHLWSGMTPSFRLYLDIAQASGSGEEQVGDGKVQY